MKTFLEKIIRNVLTGSGLLFGISKRMDYRTLSRYMLLINEMQDLDGILLEASRCLKAILNYRLFAFAVQDSGKLDVWIDPNIYQKPFRKIIEKDFAVRNDYTTHYFREDPSRSSKTVTFQSTDLISYVLMDGKYFAKLYLLPDTKMLFYHSEIINIIVKSLGLSLANHMNIKSLQNAAAFDPMTNCYNRREFERLIEHNMANASRYQRDLSVIMMDLDHFKRINDRFGHLMGDAVLKRVSEAVVAKIRKGDYLVRYGGEEFVLVLPDTKRPRAMELAERIKQVVQDLEIKATNGEGIRVTASFGVASLKAGQDKDALIQEADSMLYQAKAGGRNRVMPQMKLLHNTSKNDSMNS
ncbi:MAG: GGDEF domain-containing protein [Desulfobacteraceae bacterium]|nr:MAG: GGDEF domain-containing protein [Desulfobacteraceae bacterium]